MNNRGLIEASEITLRWAKAAGMFSAVNNRGLIEAWPCSRRLSVRLVFSAVNNRGLIEASQVAENFGQQTMVFRGEQPRPH